MTAHEGCAPLENEASVSLHTRIQDDLRTAMKQRDKPRVSALRMAVAALKNRAVADGLGPQGALEDAVIEQVLAAEVKRRREAARAYHDAGRAESAAAEEAEARVYESYLPEQLDDAELDRIVAAVIDEVGATGPKDIGAVMRPAMARVAGRAEGGRVSAAVKRHLAD